VTLLAPENVARLTGATILADNLPIGSGVSFSSTHVKPGDVFVAMAGTSTHGIEYAAQALERGAAYVLSDRSHQRGLLVADPAGALLELGREARRRLRGPVIGITGTVGKTSTKAMLAAMLQARATPGNFNTPFALAQALIEAHLAEAQPGAQQPASALVLELGIDHAGEMAQLTALTRPDHGIITFISESHLTGLGDLQGVAREKGALFEAARGVKVASEAAAEHLPPELLEGVTLVGAHAVVNGLAGTTLEAFGRRIDLPWPGRPVAENALLALTMATALGVPLETALARLRTVELEGSRLQPRQLGDLTIIDDSYNSNPVSLKAALEVLRSSPAPRAAFLGDMLELGASEAVEHRNMGRATLGLDLVVGVGSASALMRETNPAALWAPDASAAAEFLARIPEGATVLVKGSRGVKLERLVARLEERTATSAGGHRA
jgi:UDP-N-acetylmuramoyl-tripeptide--D-alanyl-D-alanine ligase